MNISLFCKGHYGVLHSPSYCTSIHNVTISTVHIYGSNLDYPYFITSHEESEPIVGQIRNTSYRIKTTIAAYKELHGCLPSRIMWSSVNWDSILTISVEQFEENTLTVLKLLKDTVGDDTVDIGLRTAVTTVQWKYADDYNEVYRRISKIDDITLYDFDEDLWSSKEKSVKSENLVFRGKHGDGHPVPEYTIKAIDKMLGKRYSGFLYDRGYKIKGVVHESIPKGNLLKSYYIHKSTTHLIFLI